jgi:hypothetical protein
MSMYFMGFRYLLVAEKASVHTTNDGMSISTALVQVEAGARFCPIQHT